MSLLGIARPGGRHRSATIRELHNRITALQTSRRELKTTVARLAHDRHLLERQLDATGIELSGTRLDLEEAQREIRSLRAALANATSASALHLHAAVVETQPIPVVPLHLSPLANPAHSPGSQ